MSAMTESFTLSWDEVDEVRQQALHSSPTNGTDSITSDDEFPATAIDELLDSVDADDRNGGHDVAQIPRKIVFETQNAFRDRVRLGDAAGGVHALERGLEKL